MGAVLRARNDESRPKSPNFKPGVGIVRATDINNTLVFVMFGVLGGALVIASIWFFFWAKNGGFRFRKGDWDEYKSTVLRRKGPNGTTLSNATRSTKLGGGSVVGSQGSMEDYEDAEKSDVRAKKKGKKVNNSRDHDVRAYRHEKVAKVGGLNREADGSYHDHTNSEMSEVSRSQTQPHRKLSKHPKHNHHKDHTPRQPAGRQFSYDKSSEVTFSVASDDSHRPLRSSPQHNRHSNTSTPTGTPRHSRQQYSQRSPGTPSQYQHNRYSSRASAVGSNYTKPLDMDSRYEESDLGTEQARNTKAYFHPIPGLSKNNNMPGGFRRGGGGRRNSLSDSEGETGTNLS